MKRSAPEAYAKFVELAVNASEKLSGTEKTELTNRYKATYSEGTQTEFSEDKAINEITADYAGKLVHDVKMFQDLARADMNTAQRFIEAIRDFIAKVKTTFSKDKSKMDTAALEKYGATVSELEAAVKTYEEMIETTQAAVSSGQFNTENTAEAEAGGAEYSIKHNIEGERGNYGKGVLLDKNIFDGVKPRNWGKY